MQAARPRPHEILAGAPLDNGDIDARQGQLPASISPVGPPPAISTACSKIGISSLLDLLREARLLPGDQDLEASPLRATYQCGESGILRSGILRWRGELPKSIAPPLSPQRADDFLFC